MSPRKALMHALIETLPSEPYRWTEPERQRFLAAVRACLSWGWPTAEELRGDVMSQAVWDREREEVR